MMKSLTPIADKGKVERTRATERMRRSRQRRREGLRCCTLELRDHEIEALVCLGLLPPDGRRDPKAITGAMHRFLDKILGALR